MIFQTQERQRLPAARPAVPSLKPSQRRISSLRTGTRPPRQPPPEPKCTQSPSSAAGSRRVARPLPRRWGSRGPAAPPRRPGRGKVGPGVRPGSGCRELTAAGKVACSGGPGQDGAAAGSGLAGTREPFCRGGEPPGAQVGVRSWAGRPVDRWSAVMAVLAGADPCSWKLGLGEGSSSGNLGRRGGWRLGAGCFGAERGRRRGGGRGSLWCGWQPAGGSEGTPTPPSNPTGSEAARAFPFQGFTRGSERSFQRAGQVFPRYMCVCLFAH